MRPLVTQPDLIRIANERMENMGGIVEIDRWLAEQRIEDRAAFSLGTQMTEVFLALWCTGIVRGELDIDLVRGFALTCFQIGWDAHLQTRGERA